MSTETSAGGATAISGTMYTHSTIGLQATIVQATLQENAEQQAIAAAPLKIPDMRQFGIGVGVNLSV